MKYQVPQFIEIEDKIFGPLTLKQFLYVGGGVALCFIVWTLLPTFIAVIIIVPMGSFFAALAFYQHNQRPFILTVESALKYLFNNKLYIWKKEKKSPQKSTTTQIKQKEGKSLPKMSDSKLKELTWSLDINRNLSGVEKNNNKLEL